METRKVQADILQYSLLGPNNWEDVKLILILVGCYQIY